MELIEMRYFIAMNFAYFAALFLQTVLSTLIPQINWLPCLAPIALVFFAINAPISYLISFTIFGGLLHDFIVGDYYGFTPLIWGTIFFMARTQRPFLVEANLLLIGLCSFFASFLLYLLERFFFLVAHRYWSWPFELNLTLISWALFCGLFSMILYPLLAKIFEQLKPEKRESYTVDPHAY
ncbi:MAG: hypothetical protein AAGA18_02555 [Verrucomicrobiota bacterium]